MAVHLNLVLSNHFCGFNFEPWVDVYGFGSNNLGALSITDIGIMSRQ
jgi:hypothetical protein